MFCSKLTAIIVYQISSVSPECYRRYYKIHFGIIFPDTLYMLKVIFQHRCVCPPSSLFLRNQVQLNTNYTARLACQAITWPSHCSEYYWTDYAEAQPVKCLKDQMALHLTKRRGTQRLCWTCWLNWLWNAEGYLRVFHWLCESFWSCETCATGGDARITGPGQLRCIYM